MRPNEFAKICDQIRLTWGQRALDDGQQEMLWRYAEELTKKDAEAVVARMLEDGAEYFTVAKFGFHSMSIIRERAITAAMEKKNTTRAWDCPHCHGAGQMVAYRRDDKWCCGLAFRCSFCNAANVIGLAPQILPWKKEYNGEFETMVDRNARLEKVERERKAAANGF